MISDKRGSVYVLLVEDDLNDSLLMKHAFEQLEISVSLKIVHDAEEAITRLKFVSDSGSTAPDLIILDLKLPGRSGFDILKWIRSQEPLKHIPVIVLSSSAHHSDVLRCYQLGANSYLVKPVRHQDLIEMIRAIKNYWFDMNHGVI